MRFSAATLLALSSVAYAAPFAIHENEVVRRKVDYQIVNVDGDSSTTTAPQTHTQTVIKTETVESSIIASASSTVPKTVTITATPSSVPHLSLSSGSTPSPTPIPHNAPPAGGSFFSPSASGFLRRDLNSTERLSLNARSYVSSSYAHEASATPLVARQWGTSSVPVSSSYAHEAFATPLVARQWVTSSVPVSSSYAHEASATPLVARQWGTSSVLVSSTRIVARDFAASPSASVTVTPTPLVARHFSHLNVPSSATPSATFSPSIPTIPMIN
ncbi:hypothetical protein N7495_008097 [Penicillium taxi]|uniref:uncharacterized protein n=1 Tax=Penicillium taxi TaxID=168475 RepID=UPI002545007F|nr:uncharacterized protein N7495_008097 [Penicillium taxi]KAJ5888056.1 hypothetical protein N7495_008097 [Penicillium taxi]